MSVPRVSAPCQLHVGRTGELPGQDHLQGDRTVEADLSRLVDDTHASARHFPDELVVAEVADGAQRHVWFHRTVASLCAL